jgi:hypothetical protein
MPAETSRINTTRVQIGWLTYSGRGIYQFICTSHQCTNYSVRLNIPQQWAVYQDVIQEYYVTCVFCSRRFGNQNTRESLDLFLGQTGLLDPNTMELYVEPIVPDTVLNQQQAGVYYSYYINAAIGGTWNR